MSKGCWGPQVVAAAGAALVLLLAGCEDDDVLADEIDGGAPADAAPSDGAVGAADAALRADAGSVDGGSAFACDPFAASNDPMHVAAVTGRIDVIDYDTYDETNQRRRRDRNAGWNFLTGTLPARPPVDGPFFTGIPRDGCITVEIPNDQMNLGPTRNIGTELILSDTNGVVARFTRRSEAGQIRYAAATNADTRRFFDRTATPLGRAYTWSTNGDPAASIRSAEAEVSAVEDFEVTPALSATTAAVVLDPNGTRVTWTPPVSTPGQVTISLSKGLNPRGDGRHVICRPIDDGEFTLTGEVIASLQPTPGLAFGFEVARAAVAPFCNEGVTSGAVVHAIVYLGKGVVP